MGCKLKNFRRSTTAMLQIFFSNNSPEHYQFLISKHFLLLFLHLIFYGNQTLQLLLTYSYLTEAFCILKLLDTNPVNFLLGPPFYSNDKESMKILKHSIVKSK